MVDEEGRVAEVVAMRGLRLKAGLDCGRLRGEINCVTVRSKSGFVHVVVLRGEWSWEQLAPAAGCVTAGALASCQHTPKLHCCVLQVGPGFMRSLN